jgi:hypothetical protein
MSGWGNQNPGRQKWKGGLLRMDNTKLPKIVHYYTLKGRRNRRLQQRL